MNTPRIEETFTDGAQCVVEFAHRWQAGDASWSELEDADALLLGLQRLLADARTMQANATRNTQHIAPARGRQGACERANFPTDGLTCRARNLPGNASPKPFPPLPFMFHAYPMNTRRHHAI